MLSDEFVPEKWPKDWRTIVGRGRLVGISKLAKAGAVPVEGAGSERAERVSALWQVTRPRGPETVALLVASARLRDWLGPSRFRSTYFTVVAGTRPGSLRFEGHGNGHGVGMCQWGAKQMGDRGFKTGAILKFYYPDAALAKLW
jgi:SpoIID/LytB domain protein